MKGLRLKQLAEKIGIKRSKIYQLVSEGKLPQPVKMGRASVWLEAEVDMAITALAQLREESKAVSTISHTEQVR